MIAVIPSRFAWAIPYVMTLAQFIVVVAAFRFIDYLSGQESYKDATAMGLAVIALLKINEQSLRRSGFIEAVK